MESGQNLLERVGGKKKWSKNSIKFSKINIKQPKTRK